MILLRRLRVENFKLLRRLELSFPPRGSVLIEGLNESGKSSLFESVYYALYGVPLATEGRGKGGLETIIRHGQESAGVELLLEVDGAELEIRRSLRRGRPSQASLATRRPGAPEEKVVGVQAVNERVVAALGALDGEALLNSCFVEQKKLAKLEDLAPGQRKDSLRRLLNLERLTAVAERVRATPQDDRDLAEAKERLELARVAARLPTLLARKAELEACLGAVAVSPAVLPPEERAARTATIRRELDQDPELDGEGSGAMARLVALRALAARARRRGELLAAGAGALAAAAAALGSGGIEAGWLALPLALAPAAAAALSLRAASRLGGEVSGQEADLALRRDVLVGRIGDLEGRRERIRARLGVDGSALDPADLEGRVARLAHRAEVRRRAADLVEGTMERIVRQVLPNTERNLEQLLPLLTAGRYHEARIGEDYQVQVWDDSAGRYVSKGLFSGGARDQFSLALRLAFALATLPQELGAAPGFIFLDEPLSSFDGPRTQALVDLLTAGRVADSFSQIFVISHNRSFDASAFTYRLVMREGRVAESNLPA